MYEEGFLFEAFAVLVEEVGELLDLGEGASAEALEAGGGVFEEFWFSVFFEKGFEVLGDE